MLQSLITRLTGGESGSSAPAGGDADMASAAVRAPSGGGHLSYAGNRGLTELPPGLSARSLDLSGCTALRRLPGDLRVRRLDLSGCTALRELPPGLSCYELALCNTPIRLLPDDLRVEYRLDLSGCAELEALPDGLQVGSLVLRDCAGLTALPEGLDVCFLDLSGCFGLRGWPRQGRVRFGHLNLSGCAQLTSLPDWLTGLAQLDLRGCAGLTALPEGLRVTSWIDIADTSIRSLPASLQGARLRWRGIPVDARIAFHPETISVEEVVNEPNVERRRVLLERLGYETFLRHAKARVLDRDRDAGGERRLLRVPLSGDEDLVCVAVTCPSTGRDYMLRVPPSMRTCRQAIAWIAGFDDPGQYRPIVES
jgi:hypothetical protein